MNRDEVIGQSASCPGGGSRRLAKNNMAGANVIGDHGERAETSNLALTNGCYPVAQCPNCSVRRILDIVAGQGNSVFAQAVLKPA
jgi:hypothetical protein